jgi:zinc transport system ATP-binding protein
MQEKTAKGSAVTMAQQSPLIEIEDLCYTRGGLDILHQISLQVFAGDFIAIIGPNGGGKSTLIKLILGLLQPSRGKIFVNGHNPKAHSTSVGYVPQYINNNLSFPATALDVVLMGAERPHGLLRKFKKNDHTEAAFQALAKLGAEELAGRKISSLSGGERQRVFIARALIAQPELLVLDEPTASIDTKGQTEFYQLLQKLNKELTILMVSHDLMIVSSYVHSIICLNRRMHYHQSFKTSGDLLEAFYSCSVEETCPVQLVVTQQNSGAKETNNA